MRLDKQDYAITIVGALLGGMVGRLKLDWPTTMLSALAIGLFITVAVLWRHKDD